MVVGHWDDIVSYVVVGLACVVRSFWACLCMAGGQSEESLFDVLAVELRCYM